MRVISTPDTSSQIYAASLADQLQPVIEALWEDRASLSAQSGGEAREAIEAALSGLDSGHFRIAEPSSQASGGSSGGWTVHQWLKKAVLLSFRIHDSTVLDGFAGGAFYDKVPLKFAGWDPARFAEAGLRAVPGAVVRRSAYVAPGVILMPSFVNVGARVDSGTMIDTWVTVGSCAQVGRDCHISGGVGIGGVLEPLQAGPVIIEDNCFIGARSEIAEGVVVGRGAVISMGVFIGASTKIVDRATGEVFMGHVPPYSVVVPGSLPPLSGSGPSLACAVIVKRVDERTRSKTAINDLLRD